MHIKQIQLKNIRTFENTSMDFSKGIHLITGSNASGKTNLLESILYLATTKSIQHRNDKNIISQEELRYVRLKKTFDSLNKIVETKIINDISELYIKYLSSYPHLFPGTINVLNELSCRYNLHIITNGFKNIQYNKLESSGILKFFKNQHSIFHLNMLNKDIKKNIFYKFFEIID